MEYKKVETGTRRDETRQKNNFIKDRSEKCNIFKTADAKILSILERTNTVNVESRRELRINREELNLNGSNKISKIYSSELIKDANFEYEEEWDICGIPELLNELDADIEKSLKNIQTSKHDGIKIAINSKKHILKAVQSKHCEREKVSKNFNSNQSASSLQYSKNKISFEKNTTSSTFTGFSKGGHLISNSTNPNSQYSTTLNEDTTKELKPTKNLEQGCRISMSSQAGNNGNISSNISGTVINITCGQNNSGSNNNNKANNKMSIDHQATLDKGLKMKIKRTKPGTKSSEAKHEIVKATEQQQNGLIGSGSSVCATSQEDITSLLSNQSTSPNSQNSNVTLAISNSQGNSNLTGSKKNLASGNNQNNMSSNSGNLSLNNSTSQAANSTSQGLSQGTKRGSSGHRRDKTREKSSHSNRTVIEKNSSATTDKESVERPLCQCSTAENKVTTCSNSSCIRKTENNTLTQRLLAKNTCGNTAAIPPGVFTPSSDASSSTAAPNLLGATSTISKPVCSQIISTAVNANTPGPPSKEAASNAANVKISSHIAAQLAAAAATNSGTNGSSTSHASYPNIELKLSSSSVECQTIKMSPTKTSSAVNHTISEPTSNQRTLSVPSSVGTEKTMNVSTLKTESSESAPAKRVKHSDSNSSVSSISKEMVDICIGTSVGTITEPDCLGPCEPGTSVTLEGIVWHETEGGVLVVNVTWRGKTYVGTLLDCTRHDWAPPRFCDSPTEDLDARSSKGRGKRSRTTITPDLSNFTETRSSIYFSHSHVHSKLRNGSTKGGRGSSRTANAPPADKAYSSSSFSSANTGSTPNTSPTALLPPRAEKRKSKEDSPPPANGDNEALNIGSANASGTLISSAAAGGGLTNQTQSLINPVTGLNVQISTKKPKTSPCAISPVLLECPENDCSKKYKHVNGLRYHQSHAHGNTSLLDEDSMAETDDHITPQHSPLSSTPTPSLTPNPSDLIPNNQIVIASQPATSDISEECNINKVNEEDTSEQLEISEKNFNSETVSSFSCENILTSPPIASSPAATAPCTTESVSSGKIHHEQQKQFNDLMENNTIAINTVLSLEPNNQAMLQTATGKSGVLRFGQEEPKNKTSSSCLLSTKTSNESSVQMESHESDSPKKCAVGYQPLNNVAFSAGSLEKSHLHQSQHNIITNKTSPEISLGAKSKRERKSPSVNDFDAVKVNSCNMSSREDVQSPAYSDISDDSTHVIESDQLEKIDVSKNSEVVKKPPDIGLAASTTCPSSHTNISSTLSNYGVYQFYQQQQQYMVQPAAEQQPPTKNIGSANISPSLTQQQTVLEFGSKKDPPLDLISKANSNQPHSNQLCQEINKEPMRNICVTGNQSNTDLPNAPSAGSGSLNSTTTSSKPTSHFYAFNYMPSTYPFNVDHNFASAGSMATSEDNTKPNRMSGMTSPNDKSQQHHNPVLYKEGRPKEETDIIKSTNSQISSKQLLKSESIKPECIKQESQCSTLSQIPQHMQIQSKDHQGIGVYTNMYQRHPLALPSQQLSREEELRRYYIFSDQQRRQQTSSSHNQQIQNTSGNQQCKDDTLTQQQHAVHSQQQIKIKGTTPPNISKCVNSANTSKESPKHKQEEELKVIKQEGQKPTMETQGPPPPPTSQYFLHPSYLTSTPFGFDPSHPMYRNVLMPTTSPYNTSPYHLPIPRYHAPEDLSRNTGTKALDALHHAASQYYTTHKIHELNERPLKSPNNSNSSNVSGTIKISGSSPNIATTQHSNIGHHAVQNQSSSATQLQHNLSSQTIGIGNKQDIAGQKVLGSGPGAVSSAPNEPQKPQTSGNTCAAPSCSSGNGSNNGNNINTGNTSDSRSPPPQRHVHTHHHTHVGLGYPMYPAPYGAAVLASQQAAAVTVINPFPPGPNK